MLSTFYIKKLKLAKDCITTLILVKRFPKDKLRGLCKRHRDHSN